MTAAPTPTDTADRELREAMPEAMDQFTSDIADTIGLIRSSKTSDQDVASELVRDLIIPMMRKAAVEAAASAEPVIAALRAEIEGLKGQLARNRWNIDEDGDDLLICKGLHDKGEKCEPDRYVRAATQAAHDALASELGRTCGELMTAKIERDEARSENDHLRASLANSGGPCAYCKLPREDWAKCADGFPGCPRGDDAMLCPHVGAWLGTEERATALEAALKPFADIEMPWQDPDHWPAFGKRAGEGWPTVGHFRAARAALQEPKP